MRVGAFDELEVLPKVEGNPEFRWKDSRRSSNFEADTGGKSRDQPTQQYGARQARAAFPLYPQHQGNRFLKQVTHYPTILKSRTRSSEATDQSQTNEPHQTPENRDARAPATFTGLDANTIADDTS